MRSGLPDVLDTDPVVSSRVQAIVERLAAAARTLRSRRLVQLSAVSCVTTRMVRRTDKRWRTLYPRGNVQSRRIPDHTRPVGSLA